MTALLPSWLEPLPDGARMRATDAWAMESVGIPSLTLMERAGAGLAALVDEVQPDGRVVVVCGKGNNGGDGYVAARLLREQGRDVAVLTTSPVEELGGDARANAERLPGEPPQRFLPALLDQAAVVIDALLGTGFSGEPRGLVAEAISALAAADAPVVAADIPSGVDASTGGVTGTVVTAAATATFHQGKPGLYIQPGKGHCGRVQTIDIGIPDGAPVDPPQVGLIGDAVLGVVPERGAASTKFTSGHVLVAGGAAGLSGAACLAAEAAARAGAGYVTVCVPESLRIVYEVRLLEVMKLGLPDKHGHHTPDGVDDVLAAADRGGALVLGPGLGRSDGAREFARTLAARAPVPLVLDADGLNAHAGDLGALASRDAATILTPHAGELARLLQRDRADIEHQRLAHARAAAAQARAVVVLKGDDTLVVAPDGRTAVSAGGAPALATAGTGDVLAGVIGALLSKGLDPFTAAAAGVHAHVLAGRAAAAPYGPNTVIASDVIAALPVAFGGGR